MSSRGKYFGQKSLLFPPALYANMLISSLFSAAKSDQSCLYIPLARSAEITEYLVLKMAESVMNDQEKWDFSILTEITDVQKNEIWKSKRVSVIQFSFTCIFRFCFSIGLSDEMI